MYKNIGSFKETSIRTGKSIHQLPDNIQRKGQFLLKLILKEWAAVQTFS